MSAADETRHNLLNRDRMLKDAFLGRNGLSMSDGERERYREQQARAKEARRVMRANLARLFKDLQ
jgi:hypothetical protein